MMILAPSGRIHRCGCCSTGTGHFFFAKYVDSVLQSRIAALQRRGKDHWKSHDEDGAMHEIVVTDPASQKYVLMVMQHYVHALRLDSRHVYQALPRLLSLWFGFTSIDRSTITQKEVGKFGFLTRMHTSAS